MSISNCCLLVLPRINDSRGNLTFVEGGRHLPFEIRRIFYLDDVLGGENRAGHALKACEPLLIAMSDSFDVIVDDGSERKSHHLNLPYPGLYVPALIWPEIEDFSSGAVSIVLASETYSEDGYYRNYEAFVAAARSTDRTTRAVPHS